MTESDRSAKFMDCATLVMPSAAAESALAHLWDIRRIESVADLTPMLVGTAA